MWTRPLNIPDREDISFGISYFTNQSSENEQAKLRELLRNLPEDKQNNWIHQVFGGRHSPEIPQESKFLAVVYVRDPKYPDPGTLGLVRCYSMHDARKKGSLSVPMPYWLTEEIQSAMPVDLINALQMKLNKAAAEWFTDVVQYWDHGSEPWTEPDSVRQEGDLTVVDLTKNQYFPREGEYKSRDLLGQLKDWLKDSETLTINGDTVSSHGVIVTTTAALDPGVTLPFVSDLVPYTLRFVRLLPQTEDQTKQSEYQTVLYQQGIVTRTQLNEAMSYIYRHPMKLTTRRCVNAITHTDEVAGRTERGVVAMVMKRVNPVTIHPVVRPK